MTESRVSIHLETDDLTDEALDRATAEPRICYGCGN